MEYQRRLMDVELDALFPELAAIALEGAKGVGKTATASRRVASVLSLDRESQLAVVRADAQVVLARERPVLVDEWQLHPPVWDAIRRAVDEDRTGGQFLLAGSAAPGRSLRIHSGAGRIVGLHMRPMALCERGVTTPQISLGSLLDGLPGPLPAETSFALPDYVREILSSGFPGMRGLSARARAAALGSYLDRALDRDIVDAGRPVRRPEALKAWFRAYAAASSTTTSYNDILRAATPGESDKPARQTVAGYRDALERMWLLDPVPAWWPTFSPLKRLAQAPKHQVADPALAAHVLDATEATLLAGAGPRRPDGEIFLGLLFESLATLSIRAMAACLDATTSHLRTQNGDHEVDLVVEARDGRALGIEVKLSGTVDDRDVRHLHWLHERIGDRLVDRVVVNTGPYAYRRPDGVAVIPLAVLGL
ncbi:MAG: ATP-binding protein [Sporichthyaceae bacterium]